jgi:hypothetical protein
MKKVILLALLMPLPALGQIVDNFETGSVANWVQSSQGHWNADTSESISGKYSLKHVFDNPDAGIDQIGIRTTNLHPSDGITAWSFLVKYGYNPSSMNNWAVFLMADNGPESMSADGMTNGYAIGVNLAGSDDTLRLWKIKSAQVTTVINCRINWQTDIGTTGVAKILVERSPEGKWTFTVSTLAGDVIGTGSGVDNELFSNNWFCIYYRYSSTCDRLLWIDDVDINGTFYEDVEAPVITSCDPAGKRSVILCLNEEPEDGIMIPENITLNNRETNPSSVIRQGNLSYLIEFSENFKNRSKNSLNINKLCDLSGNCSQNTEVEFTPIWAETGDIVISEIMADPLPEVSLPGKEYIEITNRTGYTFSLMNWRLYGSDQYTLIPGTLIDPGGIVILCSISDTSLFKNYGRVAGLKQFPSLTDGGKLIYISDSTGTFIHGVEYSSDWYGDDLKSNGGWSLEMIDTRFPFYGKENWKASVSRKGGTPGSVNSVSDSNPDIFFQGISNVFPEDSVTVSLSFTEPVFNFVDDINSITIQGTGISNVSPSDPLFRNFLVRLAEPLERTQLYELVTTGDLHDFAGNPIQKTAFKFGLSEPAVTGDILFNEILFNPLPGDQDYLELYNCSGKVIDASRLKVVSVNDASGDRSGAVSISEIGRCILPGDYYAVTTDKKKISERYFSADADHLFEAASLPSMSDDKGHLIMYNRELELIDELAYNDDMHFSLLSSHEGVALEKINPESESGVVSNWHSASESSGWGTPGATNSVCVDLPSASDNVVLSSSKISPNNDGNEDFLTIRMNLDGNGNVVSVLVFDEAGNYIKKIASNLFAGNGASVIWDGTGQDGSTVKTGIYILLITLYNDSGKTARWKKVCTVIRN